MTIQQLSIAYAIARINSSPEGLSPAEAKRRLREFGPNRIEPTAGESLPLRFAKEFTHFFALILWVAAGLAFLARLMTEQACRACPPSARSTNRPEPQPGAAGEAARRDNRVRSQEEARPTCKSSP